MWRPPSQLVILDLLLTIVETGLYAVTTVKVKELMLIGVEAIHCLSEGNPGTQATMLAGGFFDPLIVVLQQTRYLSVQVSYLPVCTGRHSAHTGGYQLDFVRLLPSTRMVMFSLVFVYLSVRLLTGLVKKNYGLNFHEILRNVRI